MTRTLPSTVFSVSPSRSAMAALDRPSAMSPRTLSLARRQLVQWPAAPRAPEQGRHDLRVDDRTPGPDSPHGGDEVGEIRHPILEQVPDALWRISQETQRVTGLHGIRQDQQPDPWAVGSDAGRGLEALRGVRRRHPDIDHRDVRIAVLDEPQQRVDIAGLADHLEARRGKRRRQRLAEEHGIVGEDHAHGITARIVVPPPGGLSTLSRPRIAATLSSSPCSPEPG